ncbi:phosphoadenosine phosphosulfate reductase domain-containing protein, partial [Caldicellulosiruptor sp. F32]|uniref:phosphoadenosine phosphosulfate reductase domain-containing protein n=1 Tax=Caldicellulosiruptor sp. F32 TaxID=1214564 RepID=UPI000585B57D
CTVFKTGPISKKINALFGDKNRVITFYGIRSRESTSRSKYDDATDSPKIVKQKVVSPIFNWFDFDVWLYIFANRLDFNDAYRLGYTRVGCWCCPNNSEWSQFLSKIYLNDLSTKWENILINFAKKIGKEDAEVYVREGKWKARQGGIGLEHSKNSVVIFRPCATEEKAFNYVLTKPISDELYEFFKPFGELNFDIGNKLLGEVFVLDENRNVVLKIQGVKGDRELKVKIYKAKSNINFIKQKIDAQITKFQMCIGCLACEGICPFNAIKVREKGYKIEETKCKHCGKCISYFDGGCYIRKVLAIKRGVND